MHISSLLKFTGTINKSKIKDKRINIILKIKTIKDRKKSRAQKDIMKSNGKNTKSPLNF